MPFSVIRADITTLSVDAVVNAANSQLCGGGGVDGAIHCVAGPLLDAACAALGGCATGEAKITPGFGLPCRFIIHTVGPIWNGGQHGEEALLRSCYTSSLRLAIENKCESIAFPLISGGAYGYPREQAIRVAVDTITDFLDRSDADISVSLVLYGQGAFPLGSQLLSEITRYIDSNFDAGRAEPVCYAPQKASYKPPQRGRKHEPAFEISPMLSGSVESCEASLSQAAYDGGNGITELADRLKTLDESFSQMLMRLIDERGMTDVECYKKANIDRKLFSKIRSDINYRPRKQTALAFAVALGLSYDETRKLLERAGFALSHSNKFDVIVEFFILRGNSSIHEINEALFMFDQLLLGS